MAKDDISLGEEMGKLEIEPTKLIKIKTEENPFVDLRHHRRIFTRSGIKDPKCSCNMQRKQNVTISKKKSYKILKDPVLKLLQHHAQNREVKEECEPVDEKCSLPVRPCSDHLSLCALVDNCNQLRISSGCYKQSPLSKELNNKSTWWRANVSKTKHNADRAPAVTQTGSCSQQALNPPCDITIDELASYFETMVHIPKKMSSMAEMMYI